TLQQGCNFCQNHVASQVPEPGVHFLEPIYVNQQESQRPVRPPGMADKASCHVVKCAAVVDFSQRVCERLQPQQLALNCCGDHGFPYSMQIPPLGDHVDVYQGQQSGQPNNQLS